MNRSVKFLTARPEARRVARALTCGVLMALPACAIPDLRPPDPVAPLPAEFKGLPGAAAAPPAGVPNPENAAQAGVQEFFNDPALTDLVARALAGNQELKILEQDIVIADNEVLARRGAYLPLVGLRAGAGTEKSSKYTREGAVDEHLSIFPGRTFPNPLPNFLVAADITWQVDIWRKLRNARDSAALRYLATAEGRTYTQTRLVADVAENYYRLMALDMRQQTLDRTIELQQQSLKLAEARKVAGRGSELEVQRFQAEVRKNQSEKLIVTQEVVEAENRVNFLLGRFPQPVERPSATFFDLTARALSVGLPAQLLQNRPDIRRAELELQAAGLDVLVARAEFFPSLAIDASVGYQAFNPKYLLNPEAFFANTAGNLVTPLVNRRAIQAAYGTANARQLQAVYSYQRVILDAFAEVVNQVSKVENYRQSIEIKKRQLAALEASVDSATKLFQNARAEYSDVLFSQRDLQNARMELIETKRQQLSAAANAYQALGGGQMPSSTGSALPAPANGGPGSLPPGAPKDGPGGGVLPAPGPAKDGPGKMPPGAGKDGPAGVLPGPAKDGSGNAPPAKDGPGPAVPGPGPVSIFADPDEAPPKP